MKNNPNKTSLLKSPRMCILMLIGALLVPACAVTQKPEPAKASAPTTDLSKQIDYDAKIKGVCIRVRELHDRLLKTNPDQLDEMENGFWETLNNCADLDEAEEQIGEGR